MIRARSARRPPDQLAGVQLPTVFDVCAAHAFIARCARRHASAALLSLAPSATMGADGAVVTVQESAHR